MKIIYSVAAYILFFGSIDAAPEVIYDSQDTVGIEPYIYEIPGSPYTHTLLSNELIGEALVMPQDIVFDIYPIETPSMTVGQVTEQILEQPVLPVSVFMIGSDEMSQQWLINNRNKLEDAGLTGFLIQAENESDLEAIQALAGDQLEILPISVEDFLNFVPIQHYPVVIEHDVIWQ